MTINGLFQRYCPAPVLCIIDPQVSGAGLPVQSYVAIDELREDGTTTARTFAHVTSGIEAEEAEEVGVEHLLRDLKDSAVSSLSQALSTRTGSLVALERQLEELEGYLEAVETGRLPPNQEIIAAAQNMFNLLPDVHGAASDLALTVKTNDQLAMIYMGSLARTAISLHELINNKLQAAAAMASVESGGRTKPGETKA